MKTRYLSLAIVATLALFLAACAPESEAPTETTHEEQAPRVHDADSVEHGEHPNANDEVAPSPNMEQHGQMDAGAAEDDAYPLANCPVTGAELGSMGDPVVEFINGREVRFCCAGCPSKFKADADNYLKKMDEEIASLKQSASNLPNSCPVAGDALGGVHGKAFAAVMGNPLSQGCCPGPESSGSESDEGCRH